MEQTLQQLGQLLLGAIPTAVLLLVLFGCYRALVARPLQAALEERYAKTEGAFEKAKADIAAADARTEEYEQRIREARVAVFKSMESRRQQALQARATAAAEARQITAERVKQEKAVIEEQMVAARTGLQQEVERLANEIIQVVLGRGNVAPTPAGGPR